MGHGFWLNDAQWAVIEPPAAAMKLWWRASVRNAPSFSNGRSWHPHP